MRSSGIAVARVCKSYLDKPNCRAACIIEGRVVKSDELSTVFGWSHRKHAVTSLNLSLFINASMDRTE